MEPNREALSEQMKFKLMSYGILVKKDITDRQGLVLIGEVLLDRLHQLWRELFQDCRLEDMAMSEEEVRKLTKG